MAEDKVGGNFAKYTTDKELLFLIYFKTVKIKGEMTKTSKEQWIKGPSK